MRCDRVLNPLSVSPGAYGIQFLAKVKKVHGQDAPLLTAFYEFVQVCEGVEGIIPVMMVHCIGRRFGSGFVAVEGLSGFQIALWSEGPDAGLRENQKLRSRKDASTV